jgi:transposase
MRHELTDFEWAGISPLLPNKPRGIPRIDDPNRAPTGAAGRSSGQTASPGTRETKRKSLNCSGLPVPSFGTK